jgi:hypothetical protein
MRYKFIFKSFFFIIFIFNFVKKTRLVAFTPYDLKFDLNEIQLTKEKFLQKKIKRGPAIPEFEMYKFNLLFK